MLIKPLVASPGVEISSAPVGPGVRGSIQNLSLTLYSVQLVLCYAIAVAAQRLEDRRDSVVGTKIEPRVSATKYICRYK